MGSPYVFTSVSRVNVVRTSRGFQRLSQEMRMITDSDFLAEVEAVVAGLLALEERHIMWRKYYSEYQAQGEEGLKTLLIELIPDWNAFCVPYLDFCALVLSNKYKLARIVVTVSTRYECSGKDQLDRAIILDFSAK